MSIGNDRRRLVERFDGDEMNIHFAQSHETRAELEELMLVEKNIVSPQAGAPIVGIIQDSLAGSYLMTKEDTVKEVTPELRADFNDMATIVDPEGNFEIIIDKQDHAESVYNALGEPYSPYLMRVLISCLFPDDFHYIRKDGRMVSLTEYEDNPEVEMDFVIINGIYVSGVMDKSIIGTRRNSIIHMLHDEFGSSVACHFVDNIQRLANKFLEVRGFSVGIRDCILGGVDKMVNDTIVERELKVRALDHKTMSAERREAEINAELNTALNVGRKMIKDVAERLGTLNALVVMISSGSKGGFQNMAQISGLLGQQNLSGRRMWKEFVGIDGGRTLPHYTEETMKDVGARGFVRSNYIKGLSPQEFWFHAVGGREGLCDTAVKTSDSGYIQRKMVKTMEDLRVHSDGTVRNKAGTIIQFAYGDTGLDPQKSVKVDGEFTFIDVERLVDEINES